MRASTLDPRPPGSELPARGVGSAEPARVTPELALVSPELGAAARSQLAERPWESLQDRSPAAPTERRRLARQAATDPPPVPRERVALPLGAAIAAGLLLVAVSVLLLLGGRPRGEAPSTAAELPTPAPATAVPATTVPPASLRSPAGARPALVPNGGYVITPTGSLVVDGQGGAIERFELPLQCRAGPLVVERIPLANGSFDFTGVVGSNRILVRVRGRAVGTRGLRGVVLHESGRCSPTRVPFTARLS